MEELKQEVENLKNDISVILSRIDETELRQQTNTYVDVKNILSLIEIVSTAPTHTPSNLYDQIKIYQNAGTYRLYVYDTINNAWRNVALS